MYSCKPANANNACVHGMLIMMWFLQKSGSKCFLSVVVLCANDVRNVLVPRYIAEPASLLGRMLDFLNALGPASTADHFQKSYDSHGIL